MRSGFAIGSVLLLSLTAFVFGCGKSSSPSTASKPANDGGAAAEPHSPDAEISKALAELPAEDRELATLQKVCPVSGEPLGSMGPPLKMDVKGQTVFLCCESCKEELLAKPDEYLAKLSK